MERTSAESFRAGPPTGPAAVDELDPELLALPRPPRTERALTVSLLVLSCLLSLAMAGAMLPDLRYAFSNPEPVPLGSLEQLRATDLTRHTNRYVTGSGFLSTARALQYDRTLTEDSFRLMPVLGRDDLWVEVRISPDAEGGRWQPPTSLDGRLLPIRDAGLRYRGLVGATMTLTHARVPDTTMLLVIGETPSSMRWSIGFTLLFLAFASLSAHGIWKLVRPMRS